MHAVIRKYTIDPQSSRGSKAQFRLVSDLLQKGSAGLFPITEGMQVQALQAGSSRIKLTPISSKQTWLSS